MSSLSLQNMGKVARTSIRVVHRRAWARLAVDPKKLVFWIAAVILPWATLIALGYRFMKYFV